MNLFNMVPDSSYYWLRIGSRYIYCKPLSITFGALALLFQPFVKIVLGRGVWDVVDIVVAILLVVLWYKENKKNETN